jgi:hypothetical protein
MPDLPIPAVPGIKATGWLVLEATRYAGGQAREMKLRRITQSRRRSPAPMFVISEKVDRF